MNKGILSVLMLGVLAAGQAGAECAYPKAPTNLPDGATANEEQMVAGMKQIKEYNTQVNDYLKCLETEESERVQAAGPDAPADQIAQIKAIRTKRHNAAFDELQSNVSRFNEQVKVYKAREKKS
jgi:hypothetical protein